LNLGGEEEEEEEDREESSDIDEEGLLITEPRMFNGKLKEYQKRGVGWLVGLYNQGINGILAGMLFYGDRCYF
jgi:SNF2 family DNA or RNA helicase